MKPNEKREPLAYEVKRYGRECANPFKLSQARDAPRPELLKEFYPTSIYWSRFTRTNEVLLGTRGSGKTVLLRMLTYSHYRDSELIEKRLDAKSHRYLGIYIPLRLELLKEIDTVLDYSQQQRQFCFIFNCVAAVSFLQEIEAILEDLTPNDEVQRLQKVRIIINYLRSLWELPPKKLFANLSDLAEYVNGTFLSIRSDWSRLADVGPLKLGLLEPLISSIKFINKTLGLNSDNCTWISCFDEAEYLAANFQDSINTLMRSKIGGFVVKVATLPTLWKSNNTTVSGVYVQAGGDDFIFTSIDYEWGSDDFQQLSNNLLVTRLAQTGIYNDSAFDLTKALEQFLGVTNDRSLTSLFRWVFGDIKADNVALEVREQLKLRPKGSDTTRESEGQIKRYTPVYMLRELYKASRQGNRKIPWLAGAEKARRVSGGNVRRFIQLCDFYFEAAKSQLLNANLQHEVVNSFAQRFCERAASIYQEGFFLQTLLHRLSKFLHDEFHDNGLKDIGLDIELSKDILEEGRMRQALEAGIGYSYFQCSTNVLSHGLSDGVKLRLADVFGAWQWVPMRGGDRTLLSFKSKAGKLLLSSEEQLTEAGIESAVNEIQMEFFEKELS